MFSKRMLSAVLLVFIIITAGCMKQENTDETGNVEQELLVSAAASLTDVMEDITYAFKKEHPDVEITLNFSGSGKLARQIQQGAPVDVFLSADQKWMNKLAEDDLILSGTKINFAANDLVLIAKKDASLPVESLEDLATADIGQIAIGNPDSVPAGMYAESALKNSGLWDGLQDRLIFAKDVRQVLTYVETGNTQAGFVYRSDTLRTKDVDMITKVDQSLTEPIIYPAAVAAASESSHIAKQFTTFLQSDIVQEILKEYGFRGM